MFFIYSARNQGKVTQIIYNKVNKTLLLYSNTLIGTFMKRSITLLLSLLGSATAFAGSPQFTNSDDSDLSQLCIAAIESTQQLQLTAAELGMSGMNLSKLACNGVPWKKFVKSYRSSDFYNPPTLIFSKTNDTIETKLCYAAVTSKAKYMELRKEYLSGGGKVEKDVMCNRIPLKSFAKKYERSNLILSLN